MRKHFLLLMAIAALTVTAWGQEAAVAGATPQTQKNYHFSIGLVGGMDRNYYTAEMSYQGEMRYDKFTNGTTYGLRMDYSPARWLTLRMDAVMIQKNNNLEHVFQNGGTRYTMTTMSTNNYVNVPLVLMVNVGKAVQLHGFGGGYVGYWLSGHRTGQSFSMPFSIYGDESSNLFDEEYTFDPVRDNRKDAGFVWGGGVSTVVAKRIELGVEVRWYYGVIDMQNAYQANVNPHYNTTMVMQGGISYKL